jgi:hypothetical protein
LVEDGGVKPLTESVDMTRGTCRTFGHLTRFGISDETDNLKR